MEKYLPSLRRHGILNVVMHLPALLATSFWGLLLVAIFNLDTLNHPFWMPVSFLPSYVPPASCIVGIVRGVKHFKSDRDAKLCVILSTVGIFLYAGMFCLVGYLGSKY